MPVREQKELPLLAAVALLTAAPAIAGDPVRLEEVSILGDPSLVHTIPGSAHLLDEEHLSRFEQSDIMRVLMAVPGVYIQEEDGAGLRPNIGIRGSGLDRSSRIALLEDGVLIAPAPYSAPAAYYFPSQRRMSNIEVLKGPASVRLGPRTTGGAMNMVSTWIPDQRAATAELLAGQDGFAEGHFWYGDATANVGWLLETVQQRSDGFKELDSGGDTGFDIRDYVAKLRFNNSTASNWHQGIELKLGYTDQVSDETYLGLTDADFDANPYRRYAASQLDQLRSTHNQYQATYFLRPREKAWSLELTVYDNDFTRNWFKLDSVDGIKIGSLLESPQDYSDQMAWVRGELDSPDDALVLRNNNRSYFSRGVQTSFETRIQTGGAAHQLQLGLRLHEDEVDRFQHDDAYAIRDAGLVLTSAGTPGSQSNRVSDSTVRAVFLEDRITAGAWEVTPGLRLEKIDMVRRDYSTADGKRLEGPSRVRENSVDVVIPGVGVSYSLDGGWLLLGGAHRGFNPPSPGSSASEEESSNFEFGARYRGDTIAAEAIAFYNDYDNLVGTCTASTGGSCTVGDQFDGGAAIVAGLESVVSYEFRPIESRDIRVPLRLAYTWTATAEFDSSFSSGFGPWGVVETGDGLPYVPKHQAQLSADLLAQRWRAGLNLSYIGETRSEAGQGDIPADELIDSHWVMDLAAGFSVNDRFELFGRIDNILDNNYVVARRPAGLRPGKPRTAVVGFRLGL